MVEVMMPLDVQPQLVWRVVIATAYELQEYAIWQLRNNYEMMSNSFIVFFNEIADYVTREYSITLE